jgi:hypothetical protein
MQIFNYPCISCANQLIVTGLLLITEEGPFLCCDVCRTLYFIDTLKNAEGRHLVVVEPACLGPEIEFDIIRHAQKRTPLKDYLQIPEERNINPHFQENLKSIIEKSTTPSDFIRKLHD